MSLIICEATWFAIADAKLYNDNGNLCQQLKLGLKCTIIWNKHQATVIIPARNQYLDYLAYLDYQIDPKFPAIKQTFCFVI